MPDLLPQAYLDYRAKQAKQLAAISDSYRTDNERDYDTRSGALAVDLSPRLFNGLSREAAEQVSIFLAAVSAKVAARANQAAEDTARIDRKKPSHRVQYLRRVSALPQEVRHLMAGFNLSFEQAVAEVAKDNQLTVGFVHRCIARGAKHRTEIRNLEIIRLLGTGLEVQDIAKRLKCSRSTVWRVRKAGSNSLNTHGREIAPIFEARGILGIELHPQPV